MLASEFPRYALAPPTPAGLKKTKTMHLLVKWRAKITTICQNT